MAALFDPASREEGDRAGDIRSLREAELAAAAERDKAETEAATAPVAVVETVPSRRSFLTLGQAKPGEDAA
jgi:predicted ATP-grasp superfamily ATP-dependent carboligase